MSEAQVVEQSKQADNVVTSDNSADFYASKLGLATEPSPTAADTVEETPASEPAAKDGESEPVQAEENATGTEEQKPIPKIEKRFDKLTKQRAEAEARAAEAQRRAEELEARLAALEGQRVQQQAPVGNSKPQPDEYPDAFKYAEALAEWSANEAVARREKEIKQQQEQAKQQEVIKTWQQKLESVKAELPDYEEMVASSSVVVSNEVRDAILESDVGPRILYELASDDELAEKITNMSTIGALRMIGKLEAKFEAKAEEPAKRKPVAAKSNAPAPINPLRGTSSKSVYTDGEQIDYQAWKAGRRAGKIR